MFYQVKVSWNWPVIHEARFVDGVTREYTTKLLHQVPKLDISSGV